MKGQLKGLTSGRYGKVGIMWFDGEWESTWTHEMGKDLYDFVRKLDRDYWRIGPQATVAV